MRRKYSDGAGTVDGNDAPVASRKPVIRYDPHVTIFDEMVNESTTHLFGCTGNIPTELGLLTALGSLGLSGNRLSGTTPV